MDAVVAEVMHRDDVVLGVITEPGRASRHKMMKLDLAQVAAVHDRGDADAAWPLFGCRDPLPVLRGRHLATVAALATGELGCLGVGLRFVGHRIPTSRSSSSM